MPAQAFAPQQLTEAPSLLRMRDLIEMTALSRATIYRAMEAGNFPLPIRIGGNNRWLLADIIDFIEARKAARGRSA